LTLFMGDSNSASGLGEHEEGERGGQISHGNESLREACPAGRTLMQIDCRLVASVSSCPSYRTEDPMAQRHAVVAGKCVHTATLV
jgi:hypothetical protein